MGSGSFFFWPPPPDRLWSPLTLLSDEYREALPLGLKPPSSVTVNNAWIYTSTRPYVFIVWWLIKQEISLHGIVLSYVQGSLRLVFVRMFLRNICSSRQLWFVVSEDICISSGANIWMLRKCIAGRERERANVTLEVALKKVRFDYV
jgi:hypothetical protein